MQERTRFADVIAKWEAPSKQLEDLEALLEMATEEGDEGMGADLAAELDAIARDIGQLEFHRMLSGEQDQAGAILAVNAGAGGLEAQDWADMLLRMYLRWCESHGMNVEMVDSQAGEEGGLKGATLLISGDYAYGLLKAEIGIHRLVRISPFDQQKRRHTSFASVFVYPQADESIVVDINEGDLRVDVYRSSGAGGQHVNKTSSAVRITHEPTGIVVQCQNERSQHKNRAVAMKILAARLLDLEREKRNEEKAIVEKSKMRIDFGSQIRSYVLAPYRLVKDHRTGHEMGNADAVLDGEIDGFIKSFLLASGGMISTERGPRSV